MIYLDNAATTRVTKPVLDAMLANEVATYFNTNTAYAGGIKAAQIVTQAREVLLQKLHGTHGQLLFTSGATESNALILHHLIRRPGQGLITTAGDHNSIYLPAKALGDRGFNTAVAPLLPDGRIDLNALANLITDQTVLFMFSLVNSDIGTYQDAAALVATVRAKNPHVHIHADAAQAFAKFDFNVEQLGLDSVTICAHKIHGPKGIGALWVRHGLPLPAREGTLNNAGIVGFAAAVTNFNCPQVSDLHAYLVNHLPTGCRVNGLNNNPYLTNLSLPGVFGETVLNALSSHDIYVGTGSACSTRAQGNRTLAAMKFTPQQQKQVLRISFGQDNTLDDVKTFLTILQTILPTISGYHVPQQKGNR